MTNAEKIAIVNGWQNDSARSSSAQALGEAIDRERAITEEHATLIPPHDAAKQPAAKK